MAKKTDNLGIGTTSETIIGTGVSAKGSLVSESDISIDGTFSGDIKAAGNVSLGGNAVVKADIQAENVWVAGQLTGNITAVGETSIAETGRVAGVITTSLLAIASGAIFIGSSKMTEQRQPLPHPTNLEADQDA